MKKVALVAGIAVLAVALSFISLLVYARHIHKTCRFGEGEAAIRACGMASQYAPFRILKWAYRYDKAHHLFNSGRKPEALAEMDDMIGVFEKGQVPVSGGTALHVYEMAAICNFQTRNFSKAGKYAAAALEKGSKKKEIPIIIVDGLLMDRKYPEVLAALEKTPDTTFSGHAYHFRRGLAYRGMGEDAKAYDSLKAAEPLTDDPKKLALLNKELGFACFNLKKYDEALARLKNAAAAGVQCDNCPALIAQMEQALAAPAAPAKKRKAAR